MKGILQLTVEIDYDKMVAEENVEALKSFTGESTVEGIINHHMSTLGNKLSAVVKDLPLMKYGVEGSLVEEKKEEEDADAGSEEGRVEASEALEGLEVEDNEEGIEEEKVELTEDYQDELIAESSFKERIDTALMDVSMNFGFPTLIVARENVIDEIKPDDHKYNGFTILQDRMEEDFVIHYKDYSTGKSDTKSYGDNL